MGCCCSCCKTQDLIEPSVSHIERSDSFCNCNDSEENENFMVENNFLLSKVNTFVLETLAVMRNLVENDQEAPPSMFKLHAIADKDSGWLLVVQSLVESIPLLHPLGPALIVLVLDDCPLPSKQTAMKLSEVFKLDRPLNLEEIKTNSKLASLHRNICVILGCIAEKHAGSYSVALLTPVTLKYFLTLLHESNDAHVILFTLIALEKFAQTTANKILILKEFVHIRDRVNTLENWLSSDDFVKRQVGFCVQWSLDNLFIIEGRLLTYRALNLSNINALLNVNDVTEYLKISPDGLQARCDASSFESIRCTFQADFGIWFYEAFILTTGVMQIGWATRHSKFLNHDGFGIGDDEFSVSYDGCRQLIWHHAVSKKHNHRPWQAGDTIGFLLDIENKKIIFYLNGLPLKAHVDLFGYAKSGFFAAASFMSFQQCQFNFGATPFAYPPKNVKFRTFNDFGKLENSQRIILPRHIKNSALRVSVDEESCTLCFDRKATVCLRPCGHTGYCSTCALILETCPMCRVAIQNRENTDIPDTIFCDNQNSPSPSKPKS